MPQIGGFQLLLLVLALPAQYLVSKWMTPTSSDREYMTRRLINGIQNFIRDLTSIDFWKNVLIKVLKFTSVPSSTRIDDNGECVAKEVFNYKDSSGYFASSVEARSPRPSKVAYRVGQVIRHKRWGYRGVIIGWDVKAKAPESWINVNHENNLEWRKMPNYSILVHVDDRSPPQTTYVPEANIEIITNTKVDHPEVDDYFESFDGVQYIPRPWLKEVYPHD